MNRLIVYYTTLAILTLSSLASMPGRVEDSNIYTAKFGEMKMFFYMTSEKDLLARSFLDDISNNIIYGIYNNTENFPAPLVIPLIALYPDPIGYDSSGSEIYVDSRGMSLFQEHIDNLLGIAQNKLGIEIIGISKDMNLVLNFDAHKFHQDNFSFQYEFLQSLPKPLPEYYLVQDLTIADWQMAKGTFSCTILQDPVSEDRFMFPIFPKEVACNFFAEPAKYIGPYEAPEYPGDVTMPFHSVVPCLDYMGDKTPGSAKGKRTSVVFRGLSTKAEIDELEQRSIKLEINRPSKQGSKLAYPNGIVAHNLDQLPSVVNKTLLSQTEINNTELLEYDPNLNVELISRIRTFFHRETLNKSVKLYQIIKRDEGFTPFPIDQMCLTDASFVVLLNDSTIPTDHQYFNISQDWTLEGLPWMQMYNLPPSRCMLLSKSNFEKLRMSPTEELLYRNPEKDVQKTNLDTFYTKIRTKITVLIFN